MDFKKPFLSLVVLLVLSSWGGTESVRASTVSDAGDTGTRQVETVTICHSVGGDSGPKEERTIKLENWQKHKKHGDKRGSCSGLKRVKVYPSEKGLKDFKVSGDTDLQFLVTSEALKIYGGDTVRSSLSGGTAATFLLSKNDSAFALRCKDRTEEFDVRDNKSLRCQMIDAEGTVSDTAYFPNHSDGKIFLYPRLTVSVRGLLKTYHFENDTTVWSLPDKIRRFHTDGNYRYFLSSYTQELVTTHELRRLDDGSLVSQRQVNSFLWELGQHGRYFYLVKSNPGKRVKTLGVFNRQFEQTAGWDDLPFRGDYRGEFSLREKKLYVTLQKGKMLVGQLDSGHKKIVDYPNSAFSPTELALDRERGLLFLYGVNSPGSRSGFMSSKFDRELYVYDVRTGKFLSEKITFFSRGYDFKFKTGTVQLRILPRRTLAIQHMSRLEFYRYRFSR